MLTRRIIPCLDVLDGRVVKGRKFQQLTDIGDPVELSARYSGEGADELVLLDISATLENRRPFFDVVERVARRVAIPLTVGGGIRTLDDILLLLRCGADKVSLNTVLVEDPLLLARAAPRVGTQALVAAIDVRRRVASGGQPLPRRHAGRTVTGALNAGERTGDASGLEASPLAEALERPAGRGAKKFEARSRAPGSTVPSASDGGKKSPGAAGGGEGWVIHVKSGTQETELDAIEWAKTVVDCGAGELLVTSIDRDGMKEGYDLEFLSELAWRVNVPIIASGGAGTMEHMADALKTGGADAVLAASVFHFNEIPIAGLKQYLESKGIPVRR
jgi:cyclase